VRILGTDQWLTTTTYYNDKGRAIQVIADNSVGGKDIATTLYDFNGKVLSNYLRHGNPRSVLTPQTTVLTMLTYDAGGRLLSVKKRLNDDVSQDKTIVTNTYDELGQLKQKRLGVTGTSSQLDSLSYTYNIRGWLQGINKAFVNTTNSKVNWFGQELNYDYGFSTNQYNGNIAGVKWKSGSDGIARAYGYNYDRVNRLTVADFTQQNTNEVAWTRNKMDFSVSNLTYDANGNIKTMNQQGMIGAAINQIDKLTYSYSSSGSNKLLSVSDASNTASAKLGDFIDGTNTGNDYSYDNNGNLVTDQNKGISTISYNHLNLPSTILITGKGSINYLYDAAGNKLKKTVVDNTVTPSKTTITDYIGGFVYKQDTLELVSHEEGRIRPVYVSGQPVKYSFDYFEKDHLGNVRVVLTDQTDFSVYSATMETAVAAKETALFSNVEETRAEKPVGYPEDGTTDTNAFVAKLNAKTGGKKIGPSLVLRVMAGDTVQINAKAFYKSGGPQDNGATPPVEDMLAGLVQAFSSGTAADGSHATAGIDNATPFNSDFYNNSYRQLKEKNPDAANPDRPKAYLNFVLFDDQFKLVDDNSGVRQVKATPDELQELKVEPVVMEKSGFLYVYTSNETEQDVFFDNVILGLASGPVLEETHYYPFGLTMAGISSNALKGANYPENRKKYNGIEFTDDLDLDIYDAQLRNLDPQIGRWNQVDPKTENMEMWSPYVSNYNNPIRYNDFLGDEPGDGPGFLDRLGNAVVQMGQQVLSAGAGAANAFVSNHLLGGGRIAAENTGLVGGNAIAYQVGQKIGDAAAAVAGAAETITAVGGEVLSAGIATPVAIPLAIEGVTTAALGLKNAFTNPIRNITLEDRAAKLNKKDRSGKDFTPAGREVVKEQNKVKNEGTMKCENCGVETPNAQKSKKGVTPPKNEAHVDHIKRKREGGRGNPDNGQVLCGGCNVEKH
jgi:RHS repeat-associated protein